MAIDTDDIVLRHLAGELGLNENSDRYQKAKAEFTYRRMKGEADKYEQQQTAIEVQRESMLCRRLR